MGTLSAQKSVRLKTLLAIFAAATIVLAGRPAAALPLVDLNSADVKTLEALPGVGPATAQAIVAGRPYKSVDALSEVKGIGKAKLEKIRPLVTVGETAASDAASKGAAAATKAAASAQAAKGAASEARRAAKAPTPSGPVNINAASQAQLEALPGIGPAKAKAIIEGRPYQKPEDIMKVRGIKQGIYNKIEGMITVR